MHGGHTGAQPLGLTLDSVRGCDLDLARGKKPKKLYNGGAILLVVCKQGIWEKKEEQNMALRGKQKRRKNLTSNAQRMAATSDFSGSPSNILSASKMPSPRDWKGSKRRSHVSC